jgi:hypothetical protein
MAVPRLWDRRCSFKPWLAPGTIMSEMVLLLTPVPSFVTRVTADAVRDPHEPRRGPRAKYGAIRHLPLQRSWRRPATSLRFQLAFL